MNYVKEKTIKNTYKLKLLKFIKLYLIFNTNRLKLYYENVSIK